MKSVGGVILGVLAALLGALILLLALVLGNAGVSRLVLERIPGLTLTEFQGRLGGQWQARQLVWEGGATRVTVEAPRIRLATRLPAQAAAVHRYPGCHAHRHRAGAQSGAGAGKERTHPVTQPRLAVGGATG